jgi:hypothetical protein
MHYLIISFIIVIILNYQFFTFYRNKKNISLLKSIFPNDQSILELNQEDTSLQIKTKHENEIFQIIISSLNNYLKNNKGAVSDYHLMKDIVERNCDTIEEEIHSQVPMPLYLGLAGTMLGILIGIGFLVYSGGLNDLLISTTGTGLKGIETLLGGVALAMISSISGIILTTIASHLTKNAKTELEKNKNTFLSWIQAVLLPNLSTDISSALVRVSQNLTNFNTAFAQNTNNLREILGEVTETYDKQKELIHYINRLNVIEIASANIAVYDKLKNCTKEIGIFANYLTSLNEYLTKVQALNQKLDEYEKRTQVIESAGQFFTKNEKWLADNMDKANLAVQQAINRFVEDTERVIGTLYENLNSQILSLDTTVKEQQKKLSESISRTTELVSQKVIEAQKFFETSIIEQQNAFRTKVSEFSNVVEEIKNLSHIKDGVKQFKEAIDYQNKKIDALTHEIRSLAKAKMEGGTIKQEITLPKWLKILIVSVSSLLTISVLLYIVQQLV